MTLQTGDERALLEGMLDRQRDSIAHLLDDVSDEEARLRLVPSLTTLLGLVTHATFAERVWFHSRVAGVPRSDLGIPETVDESFSLRMEETVASARDAFTTACEGSRVIAADHSLEEEFSWHGQQVTLRYILGHMIAELARHAGHGDILVEQIRARR